MGVNGKEGGGSGLRGKDESGVCVLLVSLARSLSPHTRARARTDGRRVRRELHHQLRVPVCSWVRCVGEERGGETKKAPATTAMHGDAHSSSPLRPPPLCVPADPPRGGVDVDSQGLADDDGQDAGHSATVSQGPAPKMFFLLFDAAFGGAGRPLHDLRAAHPTFFFRRVRARAGQPSECPRLPPAPPPHTHTRTHRSAP